MRFHIGDTVEYRRPGDQLDRGVVTELLHECVEIRWGDGKEVTVEDEDDERLVIVAHAKSSEHRGWEDFGREVIRLSTELGARIGYHPTTTGELLTDAHAALGGLSGLARAAVAMSEEVT